VETPVSNSGEAANAPSCGVLRGSRCLWLVAGMIATSWFGAWALLLSPASPRPARGVALVPRVVYLPSMSDAAAPTGVTAEVRMLWSPVLFSLPTPLGFSRDALTNEMRMRPPLGPYAGFTNFLERAARTAPVIEPPPRVNLPEMAANALRAVVASEPLTPAFDLTAVSTSALFEIVLLDGLAGRKFAETRLPVRPWVGGAKPWEAVAYLELDEAGRVVHVFLESPSPSDALNARLAQVLRAWRLAEPGSASSGRVLLRNKGRAQEQAREDSEDTP
jgi:hypothetical protein